ncbi:MAG: type II secretion system secretin GspD [Bdellovibrionaceae bacterium]|nr:type II secretion system secretin GspD [Pseudobdellovibrionaceae bacterium]
MKKQKKNLLIASLVTGLATQSAAPFAMAQEELPPPPEFDDSFAPPPAAAGGRFGSPQNGSAAAANAGSTSSVLSKGQQNKFNQSGIEDINNANFPETIESFDFPNVEITDVIKTISELTGKNFIIDPGVRGKITIIAPSKITVAEAYKAFLSALAINGYTVVPSGSFMKVKNARNAQRDSIETYSGAYYPNDDQMITRIIHLKHISAEQVNRELRILPSKDGEMNPYPPTNSIILSDYGSNIDRVMKIINQLDVPGFEEQIDVVRIRHGKAKDMADLIDKIVNKGQRNTAGAGAPGSFTAGVPRFTRTAQAGGTQAQAGNSFFMALPDDRTNSIIVVGNKAGINRVKRLVAQLDFPIRADSIGGVYVYYIKHGDAEKIAQVLQGVTKDAAAARQGGNQGGAPGGFPPFNFGGAPAAPAGSDGLFGGEVKVTADKNTNSLVVMASKQDYEQVLNLLNKIDIPRDQVFVETIIMEMAVNDTMDYKIGYYQYGSQGYGKSGFNAFTTSELGSLMNPAGGTGAILGFGQGKVVEVTDPISKETLKVPSLLGFINFLKRNTRTNVLSTPTIIAMDNETASIEVGERVATSVNSATGASGVTTSNTTFEDATIKLEIKPFISKNGESVRMEVKQSVKQPTQGIGPQALTSQTLTLATRQINTNLVIQNGDTAILGGLMKDQDTESVSKVPLLGDLPLIGWLFKSRTTSADKINLVAFLTPKIVRSQTDSNAIINEKLSDRIDFIKAAGGRDPHGKKFDQLHQRASLPPRSAPQAAPVVPEYDEPQYQNTPPSLPSAPTLPPEPLNEAPLTDDGLSLDDSESAPAPGSQEIPVGSEEGVDPVLTE